MTLLGLLGRAVAVALLFGVVLLPTADHHLASHLPGGHGSTVHRYLTHHHSAADHPVDAAPLVLPLGADSLGVAIPSPFADGARPLGPPPALSHPLWRGGIAPRAPLVQPPPLPPPILP